MCRKKLLVSAASVVALVTFSSGAQAGHSWSIYHWARTANPLPLEVVDSVTDDWQTELKDSVVDWNGSSVLDMPVSPGGESNRDRKKCKTITGKMRVCNAAYGRNGWLGLASINLDSSSHITRGVAKLNDSYSSYWAAYPTEKYSVTCQEIGHIFGLNHTSTNGSDQDTCMDYSNDLKPEGPNAHDFEQLATIYGHEDSYNSYDDGSSDDGGGGCKAPPGKGCNKNNAGEVPGMGIRVHGNDRFEIWVASDNRGGYWIHYLILAPFN